MGGMGSQNLLNLIDTYMVGRLGTASLAAVGQASALNFASIAFITGLSAGVQAMASRRLGEGRDGETAIPLNGGLVLVLCLAVPLSLLLILAAPWLVPLMMSDPEVIDIGTDYYRVRLLGMVAVGANYAFRGYWNGVSMSRLYLRTLLIMHASNVIISYVLIFGELGLPAMGATGAGLGTTISTYIGTATYFLLGMRHARGASFLHGFPSKATIKSMLRLSWPSGAQQTLFAAGMMLLFMIFGMISTDAAAAANVLLNIMLVALLPGLGLGLAAASLVGQALGRGNKDDATAWGWDVARVAIMVCGLLGMFMVVFPRPILWLFLRNQPEVLELSVLPLRIVGFTVAADAVSRVLLQAIMGAGATMLALLVSISAQWLVFLPAAYLVGPVLDFGLLGVWATQGAYAVLLSVTLALLWRSRRWASIEF
ncbi:MATE family efflux transporter [Haliangium ochraceum]|uniref:Multidrug-efflux transporter n=1 Tax=Haliangium ochraceum (strain DSM 14365 / JCM 11303 / SMP-2) TaxID=502025 RepID=D0LP42_HALO1|nr:MATE family efflux transporter [Haliangium ochraceum]ACY18868.1 MATE efflux family protein [Haliangium ochraceum DSM 14365]